MSRYRSQGETFDRYRSRSRSASRSRSHTRSRSRGRRHRQHHDRVRSEVVKPSTSGREAEQDYHKERSMTDRMREKRYELTPEEKAERYVREAEKSKARIFQTPGKEANNDVDFELTESRMLKLQLHTAIIDEDYETVASHIDDITYNKIVKGDYVDFAKLIPKDKIKDLEDNRLQLYHRDGLTYYAPPPSGSTISSFAKWERAFRVFADIYMRAHPSRAWELNEYNHMIHHISQTYVWPDCYRYDVDFRLFMAKHPERSWSIVLQKAWHMQLNEKISRSDHPGRNGFDRGGRNQYRGGNSNNSGSSNDHCRRFNRGRCTYGATCRYEHRCSHCNKFGHGIHNCRKYIADKGQSYNQAANVKTEPNFTPVQNNNNHTEPKK